MFAKRILFSVFALLIVGVVPLASHAATFSGGEEYSLRSSDVIEGNAYVGGGMVTVEGGVMGDLFAGGGNVIVSGSVTDDLFVGGGSVFVSGDVTGDVRVAGGDMTLSGYVGGELVAAGGYVHITSGSVIEGDVLVTGGRLLIEGTVKGNVEAYGGEVEFAGTVEGTVISQSESIVISENAVLNGGLTYKSFLEADVEDGAQINGDVVYEKLKDGAIATSNANVAALLAVAAAFFTGLWFLVILITLVSALVLYALLKDRMKLAVQHTFKKFWPETVRGFVLAILLPLVIALLFISIVGAGLGMIALALFGLTVLLAKIGASVLAGSLVFRLVTKKYEVNWKTILVGVIVLSFLRLVPVVGGILCTVLFFAAFGTIWLQIYKAFTKKK
ncbi:MAG: polymer-forming cytoskeletal protein [Parcubacteria group bacterium]|nr:polymer-forming cytoskeletal protein [Parcubacteria group bacterium]